MANPSGIGRAWNWYTEDRPKKYRGRMQRSPEGVVTGIKNETYSYSGYVGKTFVAAFIVGALAHDYDSKPINSLEDYGNVGVEGAGKIGDTADAGVHIAGGMVGSGTRSLRDFTGKYVQVGRRDEATTETPTTILPGTQPTTPQVIGATLLEGTHRVAAADGTAFDITCTNARFGEVAGGSPENALVGSFQAFDADSSGVTDTGEGTWKLRQAVVLGGFVTDTGRPQGTLEIYGGVPIPVTAGQPPCGFVVVG